LLDKGKQKLTESCQGNTTGIIDEKKDIKSSKMMYMAHFTRQ